MPPPNPARQDQLLPRMALQPAAACLSRALNRGDLQVQIIKLGMMFAHQSQLNRAIFLGDEVIERAGQFPRDTLHPGHGLHQKAAIYDDLKRA